MKKTLLFIICLIISSSVFAGDFVIKNGVLLKYKGNAKNIVIPNGVKTISKNAFNVCIDKENYIFKDFKCETMTIPASVTYIECTETGYFTHETVEYWNETMPLKSITVDKNNKKYCSVDGVLYSKDKTKLIIYPPYKKGSSFTIPSYVSCIGSNSFYGIEYLKNLKIPYNVKRIKNCAVSAGNLKSLTIENPNIIIELAAFSYLDTETCSINIPNKLHDLFYKFREDTGGSYAISNVP